MSFWLIQQFRYGTSCDHQLATCQRQEERSDQILTRASRSHGWEVRIQTELNECNKLLEQQKISPEVARIAEVTPSYYDQAFTVSSSLQSNEIYDTGATSHMSSWEDKFTNHQFINPCCIGVAAKGINIWATKTGSVSICRLRIDNALYFKELTGTLISVGWLCDAGYQVIFTNKQEFIMDWNDQIVGCMVCYPSSNQLWHPLHTPNTDLMTTTDQLTRSWLWHLRLGHAHPNTVISLLK